MKKQLLTLAIALSTGIATVTAQGNFQRKTPEERVQQVHAKIDSAFKLDADKMKQVDEIFLNYFKTQEKKMEEMRASGGEIDRDAMREQRQKMNDERDEKLKAVFTEEQLKKWKDEIEPSLRPQRGNRGGRD